MNAIDYSSQTYPNNSVDLMVCIFLEPTEQGASFYEWPLHITLASWFKLENKNFDRFLDQVDHLAKYSLPIKLITGQPIRLGHKKSRIGLSIDFNERLNKLHNDLIDLIDTYGTMEDDQFIKDKYLPHITLKQSTLILPGSELNVNRFYLVSKSKDSYRHVTRIIKP